MDRSEYKKSCIKRAYLSGAGYLFLMSLILLGVLKPQYQKLKSNKNEINAFNVRRQFYDDFTNIVEKAELQKVTVNTVIKNFRESLMSKDMIEQDMLEEMGKLTRATKIRMEKLNITPLGSSSKFESRYEKQVWNFNFHADYKKVVKFVNLLEKNRIFFGIDRLSISSGREKRLHRVNMSIYTVVPVTRDSDIEKIRYDILNSTEVFNFPANSLDLVERIKKKRGESAELIEIGKDPMFFGDTILVKKKEPKVVIKKKKESFPELALGGIIWDAKNPVAIIDGKVLGVGDFIKGVKIIKITETSITVLWKSRRQRLKLGEGEY